MHNFIRGDQNRAKRGKSWALSKWLPRVRLFFSDCPDWGDFKTLAFDSFSCIIDIFQAEANGKKRQPFVFFSLIRISWSLLERGEKKMHPDTIAWVIGFGCRYVADMYQIISRISTWFFAKVGHWLEGLQVKGEDVNYLLKWFRKYFSFIQKAEKATVRLRIYLNMPFQSN